MPIRILIADDHPVVSDGLRALLKTESDMEVIGQARDGREAVQRAIKLSPDIVVMELAMPGLNGIEATREIRKACRSTRVVVLSGHVTSQYIHHALRAGADGYIPKDAEVDEIVEAIRAVHRAKRYLGKTISPSIIEKSVQTEGRACPLEKLSSRERQILQMVVEGQSGAHVARTLSLSVKTVETYRSRLMRKLGLKNLPQLVKFAIEHGLTTLK